ncbi:hypothetical protein SAMN06265379_11526 [Saccharicrinis carchari]|uniref:Uncharacterized protein n=1 Tax=Saccharicrinis carchari TaxID=1168039 RepID=A0A521F6U4_SACCC|nr:hypothetical protein SAMN06265379_11526 [Saccharicrinis carchari]
MEGCIGFVKTGSIKKLKSIWPDQTKYLELWYNPVYIKIVFEDIGDNMKDVLETLRVWSEYILSIWDPYQPIYNLKMKDYPSLIIKFHQYFSNGIVSRIL